MEPGIRALSLPDWQTHVPELDTGPLPLGAGAARGKEARIQHFAQPSTDPRDGDKVVLLWHIGDPFEHTNVKDHPVYLRLSGGGANEARAAVRHGSQ